LNPEKLLHSTVFIKYFGNRLKRVFHLLNRIYLGGIILNERLSLQLIIVMVFVILAVCCTRREAPSPAKILERYIEAANRHDVESVRAITAKDAIWYPGQDTLIGREQVLRSLAFDEGANTVITVTNFIVNGDTIKFELTERNDVLDALGIGELHHFGQMVIRKGLIVQIMPRRPPLEQEAYVDSALTFRRWLRKYRPEAYDRILPGGKFNYTRSVGEEIPALILEWKKSEK